MEKNIYKSDWHIHSQVSYDANLSAETLLEQTKKQGITEFGITDHVNFPSWISYLHKSRELWEKYKQEGFHLGVELTTISQYQHDYDRMNSTLEGYIERSVGDGEPIQLPLTLDELKYCGVEYTVCAVHWTMNVPREQKCIIRDYHRQQMYLATDSRVDIIGHPWWIPFSFQSDGCETRFTDFSVIPKGMIDEFAAAMKENNKVMEYNLLSFAQSDQFPERFCKQYAEFTRDMFERGVPISIGSDEHGPEYCDYRESAKSFLEPVGFSASDFVSPNFRKW